jgi:YbgC/YbaW family acyl-CoA thioester hydrolase
MSVTHEYHITRRVEFSETDMAGIVHFSNFFRYMESVEHAFLRSLGFSVVLDREDPPKGFPRVHADCDYKRPLRFEDLLEIRLLIAAKGQRSIKYQIRFTRLEPGPAEMIALGHVAVVCVQKNPDGRFLPVPIPEALASQIEVAPTPKLEAPLQ